MQRIVMCLSVGWIMACGVAGTAHSGEPPIRWREVDAAWQSTKTEKRPLLLFVTMDGCSYCTKMKADTYGDARVARAVTKSFVPASFNASQNAALAKKLGVRVYPTTVIISSDSKVLDAINGYVAPDRFHARLVKATRLADQQRK